MRITAAVTENRGAPFHLVPLELDEPRAGEVVLRMVGVGVCHTDLNARDQLRPVPLPAVFGHEGAGVVEAVGDGVSYVEPGDHVVLTFNSCGACRMCVRGRQAYCDQFGARNFAGTRADGSTVLHRTEGDVHGGFFGQSSFATHALATERNVVKVDQGAPLKLLGPLGCGIQTGAGGIFNSLRPEVGSSIAVFGAGGVGMSAVLAAVIAGCTTIAVVDINEARLQLAKKLGATHLLNPADGDVVTGLRKIGGGLGVDYAVETTGVPSVLRQSVDALNQGGVCGLIGGRGPDAEVTLNVSTVLFGRTVRGIHQGDSVPRTFIPMLVDLYQQGRFPIDRLIKTYPFTDINQAVEDTEKGLTVKPVLTFE